MMGRFGVVVLVGGISVWSVVAADWPQWMGPQRDGTWPEDGILRDFPKEGPRILWRTPIAGGYAGPAVAAGRVFVSDRILAPGSQLPDDPFSTSRLPGKERLLCLDAQTGRLLWKHEYDCPYEISYAAGPRCTPTVADDKVYFLGAMGDLYCLKVREGSVVWSKNLPREYNAKVPTWGYCGHPLVHGNLLYCIAGGEGSLVVAFDKDSGREVWKALTAREQGYAPPTLVRLHGRERLLIWHAQALNALDPLTGKLLWSVPLAPKYGMAIMAPRLEGDIIYAGGIGGAAVALKALPNDQVEILWKEAVDGKEERVRGLYPVNVTPILHQGILYGVDQEGMLRAVELHTGKRLWFTFLPVIGKEEDEDYKGAGSGTAFIVKNGDRYFIFAETGHLIIAELTPKGYKEISRAKVIEPTNAAFGRKVVWSHPAFANKCAYIRNDKEIICVSLAQGQQP
ncbi:MAG: PQQ-like beta-propeller repeat protein [Gemmataceae bacterium]|nr:PQQ-like beta-propeller repeat protein [Gemmataceae bacterium]MCS7270151.1 PQQ-like beta-propeller repeat protein [Gemmataceae bacterium]MDW8243942.1 PQQ-binding-like beta-propeller repeat protein [Thermogemmata sp.]